MGYSFYVPLGNLLHAPSNPTDRRVHTTAAVVIPVVEHWLEWEIAQWFQWVRSI